jgi:hypothetical protein
MVRGWGCVIELDEEGDDGVEDDAFGGEELAHVSDELLGGDAVAVGVFFLEGGDGELSFGGGEHEGVDVVHVGRSG